MDDLDVVTTAKVGAIVQDYLTNEIALYTRIMKAVESTFEYRLQTT